LAAIFIHIIIIIIILPYVGADEEEDVIKNWKTLRKGEDAGNCKRMHYIALSGELALEAAVYLS
jgi:uncharacterized membrane protein YqiK